MPGTDLEQSEIAILLEGGEGVGREKGEGEVGEIFGGRQRRLARCVSHRPATRTEGAVANHEEDRPRARRASALGEDVVSGSIVIDRVSTTRTPEPLWFRGEQ